MSNGAEGHRVAAVSVRCWQNDENGPVAIARQFT